MQSQAGVVVAGADNDVDAALVVVGGVAGAEAQGAQHLLVFSGSGIPTEGEHPLGVVVAGRDLAADACGSECIPRHEAAGSLLHEGEGGFVDGVVAGLARERRIRIHQTQARVHQHRSAHRRTGAGPYHQRSASGAAQLRWTIGERRDANCGGDGATGVAETIGTVPAEACAAAEVAVRREAQLAEIGVGDLLVGGDGFTVVLAAVAIAIKPQAAVGR